MMAKRDVLTHPFRGFAVGFVVVCVLAASAPLRAADAPVVLVVGDSISAGFGLAAGESWVDLLGAKIKTDGYPYRVVNASISGDTTAGGRARVAAVLKQYQPAIVIVELGGNDALRGGNLTATRDNLDAIVSTVQAAGAKVVIVGMRLPPNYGAAYVHEFGQLFADVAKARKAVLVPFVFEGFGDDLAQFQPDRVHPTAAAQPRILANVWPVLSPLLRKR
jgi:acyl-CoA thioesterase I